MSRLVLASLLILIGMFCAACAKKENEIRGADSQENDGTRDRIGNEEGDGTEFTKTILKGFIVGDLDAKNLSVSELCDEINAPLSAHLDSLGLGEVGFVGLTVAPDTEASKTKLFFHVRGVSVKSVLDLITAQTGIFYTVEGGEVKLAYPNAD